MKTGNTIGFFLILLVVVGATFFIGKNIGQNEAVLKERQFLDSVSSTGTSTLIGVLPVVAGRIESIEGQTVSLELFGYNSLPSSENPSPPVVGHKQIAFDNETIVVRLKEKPKETLEKEKKLFLEQLGIKDTNRDINSFINSPLPFTEEEGKTTDLAAGQYVSVRVSADPAGPLLAKMISIYPAR